MQNLLANLRRLQRAQSYSVQAGDEKSIDMYEDLIKQTYELIGRAHVEQILTPMYGHRIR